MVAATFIDLAALVADEERWSADEYEIPDDSQLDDQWCDIHTTDNRDSGRVKSRGNGRVRGRDSSRDSSRDVIRVSRDSNTDSSKVSCRDNDSEDQYNSATQHV